MIDLVRHHVRYSMHWGHTINTLSGPKAVTRADYNRAFGAKVPDCPVVDEGMRYPWAIWRDLNRRRPPGEGVTPISYREIESFCRMTNECLSPEDVRMVLAVDDAFVIAVSEERAAADERKREIQKNRPRR